MYTTYVPAAALSPALMAFCHSRANRITASRYSEGMLNFVALSFEYKTLVLLFGYLSRGSIHQAHPTLLFGFAFVPSLGGPAHVREPHAWASSPTLTLPPISTFGVKSVGSAAPALLPGTVTMAAITAIAASTAVKTIHPSRDMFLNLLILSSSSGTNTYIRFPVQRVSSLNRT